MTAIEAWGERLTPEFGGTLRRFPFPIILIAIATGLFLYVINQPFQFVPDQSWMRAAFGLATAAIFATAGVFFAESRPQSRWGTVFFVFVLPVVAGLLFQVRETTWSVPYALPLVGALWLSVAGTLGPRKEMEPRFWWLNHRAIATGAIAGLALGIVCVGFIAIERTVSTLFGLDFTTLIYKMVLPVIGLFFAPVYWLSTLPRLSDYDPRALSEPDFLARAVGLVGKFILIPLLFAYAAILVLYAAQIAVTQQLPQGMLGWMVTGFVLAGAGAWLVLYPPFVRDSFIVRVFVRSWFWLTLLPLALFFYAVWVRIDAYGFTQERLLLVWAGLWGTLLSVVFIIGRGDIRMIPGLAAIILLVATIGPWNIENLPRWQHSVRLDLLMSKAGPNGESLAGATAWTDDERQRAIGSITYLSYGGEENRRELVRVLGLYGHQFDWRTVNPVGIMVELTGEDTSGAPATSITMRRDYTVAVDVSATPFYITRIDLYGTGRVIAGALRIDVDSGLWVSTFDGRINAVTVPLPAFDPNATGPIDPPTVDFRFGDIAFRIVIDELGMTRLPDGNVNITRFSATLFGAAPPPAAPTP